MSPACLRSLCLGLGVSHPITAPIVTGIVDPNPLCLVPVCLSTDRVAFTLKDHIAQTAKSKSWPMSVTIEDGLTSIHTSAFIHLPIKAGILLAY